ncbi:MAG: NDP-sugar synthase [Proteobacteria bacterium]|nr:NDP-sugar synthase [Pseudomonadota bacterium]
MGPPAAFILAAGLGTRLAPLTDLLPKPLVPVFHKPLLTFAFDSVIAAGFGEIAFNTHHLPGSFAEEFGFHPEYRGRKLTAFHEPLLLDTGGGIRNARPGIGWGTFLVYNGDILADMPLKSLLERHRQSGVLATLLLRPGGGKANVLFDPARGLIRDLRGELGVTEGTHVVYSGIALFEQGIFDWIPSEGPYSVIDALIDAMRAGEHVGGLLVEEGLWIDLGTPTSYLEAHRLLAAGSPPSYLGESGWPVAIHPQATVFPGAVFEGVVSVAPGAVIGKNARIKDSVIWPGSIIGADAVIEDCVVSGRVPVGGHHRGGVL